ncbi:TfuA-like protein [Streptomyces pseudogriseolus]|uniref:TfuA-like protein n=1 Tax=Streptomyces pseudogriseolus TaxID=36817 RepID=UPI003FA2F6E8
MTPRRIVFVGPTLPEQRRPAGCFEYRPPVKHGDLFDLCLRPGDQVLIVDGVYQHYAPVRHKEILAQLARGVHVFGTASLGALRAAELADFGMRGLGEVYAEARAGRLVADADVAVLHADDHAGARRLTEAMVSVRHGLAELLRDGKLDTGQAARLEQAAARLHFTERSATGLRHTAGADRDAMHLLLDHLDRHGDVKTRDARHALDILAAAPVPPPPAAPGTTDIWSSSYGREWDFEHRPLRPGSAVGARLALACLQLFAADFPERHRAYTLRLAAATTGRTGSAGLLLGAAGFAPATRPHARLARATEATAGWDADERLLARTFRLPPGRLVYQDLPAEAVAGSTLEELEERCLRLLLPASATALPTPHRHTLLRQLWQAGSDHEYRLCALERGFRDTAEAARLAGAFDLALVARLLHAPAAVR